MSAEPIAALAVGPSSQARFPHHAFRTVRRVPHVQPVAPRATAVVIATERLQLRRYSLADFDAMHALMSRREIHKFPARAPFTEEESWSRLLRHIGHWHEFGFGFMAVEERATGRIIGEAGLSYFRRGLDFDFAAGPEATWTVSPEHQGRGYASEAAAAALNWAEERLGFVRTSCMIHVSNQPSLRVADKLGFREGGRATYLGQPVIFFERRRIGA